MRSESEREAVIENSEGPSSVPFFYLVSGERWKDQEDARDLFNEVIQLLRDGDSQLVEIEPPPDLPRGIVTLHSQRELKVLEFLCRLIDTFLVGGKDMGDAEQSACAGAPNRDQIDAGLSRVRQMSSVSHSSELTIIIETDHVDASYRDMYYSHYSRAFFRSKRNSSRLCFFAKHLSPDDFLEASRNQGSRKEMADIEDAFIGSCVLGSYNGGYIGRSLFNPAYLLDSPVEVRISTFPLNVLGVHLEVRAFPYHKQDGEMMKCAEVTLLNLMGYYSQEYADYHQVLPSEILQREREYADERVTPSLGLPYDKMSKILSDFCFYLRLYNSEKVGEALDYASGVSDRIAFKRLLHTYLASGIPVAVNVGIPGSAKDGHSIICIGYEDIHNRGEGTISLSEGVMDTSLRLSKLDDGGEFRHVCVAHAADIERKFVVIDDGQMPYVLRSYDQLSSFTGMRCINYLVPLHRSMGLDAADAYSNIINILGNEDIGLLNWGKDFWGHDETLVLSLYLTSVRGFKRFRVGHEHAAGRDFCAQLYEQVAMPHFVWVADLMEADSYLRGKDARVSVELVLDSTSGGAGEAWNKIILMRYPEKLYCRTQDGTGYFYSAAGEDGSPMGPMDAYTDNLEQVDPA